MSGFSASDAALEGFQIIRAQWRIVLGWCLFSVVSFVGLLVVGFVAIVGATLAAASRDQAAMLGGVVGGLVFGLGGVAIQWVVLAALFRLELRPGPAPGLYYLRFSKDEARLFGLWLTLLAGFVGLMTAGYVLLRTLEAINGLAAALGTLVFLGAMVWLSIRVSLAGPANFATGRFGLADSWRLTKGRFWALLGMVALALSLLLLIAVVLFVATAVIQAGIGGFRSLAPVSLSDPQALAERPGAYVFGLIAELVIAPLYLVIGQAPFVAAYKALSTPD
ncbi:MAG TPA: hypothetical protein VFE10_04665 [Phenylobacterium sp.]|jgi:hypothetical protein|nr:hypothetical protein [Phenylobacterium sp.]